MHDKKLRNLFCGRLIVPEHTEITSLAANTPQCCFSRKRLEQGQTAVYVLAYSLWSSIASGETHPHPWGAANTFEYKKKHPTNMRNLIPTLKGTF